MWDPTTCQICGDGIGLAVDGSAFCACESCQFPVCRPCYEYERKEGLRGCPNCKAVYRRIRGSPVVDGDPDEGPVDIDMEVRELVAAQQRHQLQQQQQPQPRYDGIGRGGGSFVFGVEGDVASQGIPGQDPAGYGTAAAAQQQRFEQAGGVLPAGYGVSPMQPDIAPRTFQGDPETSSSSDYEHSPVRQHGAATVPPGGPLPGMGAPGSYVVPNSASTGYGMPQSGPLVPADSAAAQGNGTIVWKGKTEGWKSEQQKIQLAVGGMPIPRGPGDDGPDASMEAAMMDEARQPLSRKEHLPSNLINPYRLVIVLRLVITALFLWWRIENPVEGAFPLWITSIICEIWFALSWILDQFPKWSPIKRQTFLDRLSMRYEIGPTAAAGLQAGENGPAAGGAGLNQLSPVDIFVSTVDPIKEPAITTCNTLLSILSLDYPADKVACYLSDDGGSMITFDCMAETAEFARLWVPFCKKYRIEPRCPDVYFLQKVDFLKDKVDTTFAVERREMKKQYEEFRVRINQLVSRTMPDDGWVMQDGTPWPGNKSRDHPGMIQVFLGPTGGVAEDGKTLPRMVYVSREKRPGYNHHKKAGAMNSLVRVSAVLTNAPYILNLDCDHYINNCQAVREGMCFMMDPNVGPKACYVQFPQRFDGIDPSDRYANHNTVFFDINLPGLDGVQGPVYVGTGCMFRRAALYGTEPPKKEKKKRTGLCALCCSCFSCCSSCNLCSMCCCCLGCCGSKSGAAGGPGGESKGRKKRRKGKKGAKDSAGGMGSAEAMAAVSGAEEAEGMGGPGEETETLQALKQYEGKFGRSPVFVLSTFHEEGGGVVQASPGATLKEAINVISCGYEDRTLWGKEIGWIYGSVTEDILTGFKMHCRGWRSIYCQPRRVAFKGSAPINLSDRLQQVLRWALGSVEIFVSRHCPIWYGWKANKLKVLQRLSYINTSVYPFTSFPLLAYCCLPAICLFVNKFIIPEISGWSIFWFIALFLAIFANGLLEMRWSGVSMTEWWRNEQFWVIGGVSAHLFAVFQGLLKVIVGIDTNFTVTAKQADDGEFAELYIFKWTSLLIPPLFLVIFNLLGIVSGTWQAVNSGGSELGSLFGKLFFSLWVILHLWPFVKGLGGRHKQVPTLVIVWSALLASVFSLLWVRVDPWSNNVKGPSQESCGNRC